MKRISKALSLLLCIVMVISIGAISGQAVEISADSAVSTVENGRAILTAFLCQRRKAKSV